MTTKSETVHLTHDHSLNSKNNCCMST